jgi:hypothetical protein
MDKKAFEAFKNGTQDANTAQESSPETTAKEATDTAKAEATEEKLDLTEGTNRTIPYARFKEKVEGYNNLKAEVEKIQEQFVKQTEERDRQWKQYYEAEMSAMARQNQNTDVYEDYDTDPVQKSYEDKVSKLVERLEKAEGRLAQIDEKEESRFLKSEMAKLREIYPEAGEEHVLALKKVKPNLTLEQCAERSHKYFMDNVNAKYSKMMEAKKEAAKKTVITGGKINIKPEDKPRTMKEAKEFLAKYLED